MNALALRGEEGRSTLRKDTGSCEQALIRIYPNGETHRAICIATGIHTVAKRTQGTDTSKYLQERKSTETPKVVASEIGSADGIYNKNRNNVGKLTVEGESPVRVEGYIFLE